MNDDKGGWMVCTPSINFLSGRAYFVLRASCKGGFSHVGWSFGPCEKNVCIFFLTMCGDDNDRIVTALMHAHIPFHCCLISVNCVDITESEKDLEWLHN